MTNPVDPTKAAIPSINSPLVDPSTGTILNEWYRWALAVFNRTGGFNGASTGDANTLAQTALTTAQSAKTTAVAAQSTASAAATAASAAQTAALAAQGSANTAQTTATAAMTRAANLSDVSSLPSARYNLGVADYPVVFVVPAPSAASQYVPIVRRLSLTVTGAQSYCGTPPTANATFAVKVVRASTGAVENIGTITLTAHSYSQNTTSATQTAILNVGDTLQLVIPSTDATEVGITLKGTLN